MGKWITKAIQTYLGTFRHNQGYPRIILAYSVIIRSLCNLAYFMKLLILLLVLIVSCIFRTFAYPESWHIQNPGIFFSIYTISNFSNKKFTVTYISLMYLNAPGIPVRKLLQNRQIVEEQLDVWVLGVICASLLTGRHLLMNKKDKNNRYTNIKIIIIWRKT